MFAHVSISGILLAALSAMIVGTLWYSPLMFGSKWLKIVGISEKDMARDRKTAVPILILVSLITAYGLSLFTVFLQYYQGGNWFKSGIEASLIASIAFACTAVFAHGVFIPKDKKLIYINCGNRIITILMMGIIISLFMRY